MSEPESVHRIEQSAAAAREFAAVTRAYFDSLREEGFTGTQALKLTVEYQNTMLSELLDSEEDG